MDKEKVILQLEIIDRELQLICKGLRERQVEYLNLKVRDRITILLKQLRRLK